MALSHALASVFLSICRADLLAESEYPRDGATHYRIFLFLFFCFQQPCYFHAIALVRLMGLFTQRLRLPPVEPLKLR